MDGIFKECIYIYRCVRMIYGCWGENIPGVQPKYVIIVTCRLNITWA